MHALFIIIIIIIIIIYLSFTFFYFDDLYLDKIEMILGLVLTWAHNLLVWWAWISYLGSFSAKWLNEITFLFLSFGHPPPPYSLVHSLSLLSISLETSQPPFSFL